VIGESEERASKRSNGLEGCKCWETKERDAQGLVCRTWGVRRGREDGRGGGGRREIHSPGPLVDKKMYMKKYAGKSQGTAESHGKVTGGKLGPCSPTEGV